MTGYPLLLDLTGRPVLVVGGGPVALRRVRGLVQASAAVHVVAPLTAPELDGLGVRVSHRPYAEGDLLGCWLVHACTDDTAVNAAVARDAAAAGIFCVRADAAEGGSASTPAVTRLDGLTVAVSAGGDPRRAVAVR
ncbi:MAG: uroporphyrinogen-III C-methyltransferase, partial [Actinomycetota bacterium]|nr:uroporphyrinogen-III C-methyltransferase [Actinomycetota bacterium]